jgi:hypothetical protein
LRDELEKSAAELRRLQAEVIEDLGSIERSDEGEWEDLKIGAEKALTAMQGSLASVHARNG